MVFNWKLIAWIAGLVVALLLSIYLNIDAYHTNNQLREKIKDYSQINKDLKIAYDEELSLRTNLLRIKSNMMKEFDRDNKNEKCYNDVIPDNIIERLPK